MQWTTVQRDFVERTLNILEQYDEYASLKRVTQKGFDELEVTLLVNCLTGLIVVPYEFSARGHPAGSIQLCAGDNIAIKDLTPDWGLGNSQIDKICGFDHAPIPAVRDASLRVFIYRMRNALAHSRFEDGTKSSNDGIGVVYQVAAYNPNKSHIEELIFQDKDQRFKAVLAVKDVRKFATKFAHVVLHAP